MPGKYNTTAILIFTDNEIEDENIELLYKILRLYQGNSGETIEYKIIFDDEKIIYTINVIVICFNTLLADINNRDYLKFIELHKQRFMEYYSKVFRKLIK
jgi:hypothetical protein